MIGFLALAWLFSLAGAGYIGFNYKKLLERLEVAEAEIKKRIVKPEIPNKSTLIDLDDIGQRAQFEKDEEIRRLNY